MAVVQESPAAKLHTATLVRSERITPEGADEVRHLVFRHGDATAQCQAGQCVCVMAPGQSGNKLHPRMYLVADPDTDRAGGTEFAICVKRHSYIDDFNGERYPGVASNYLCDLKVGSSVEFVGPVGYPFAPPADRQAGILMIGMGTGIAPFRAMIRHIYENLGSWEGKVRLFYGAKTGLDMLYMNDANKDLSQYVYQPTFKAFQAISPRPVFDAPVELDKALAQNAAEVWEMVQAPGTHIYLAGADDMLHRVEDALAGMAGSVAAWQRVKGALRESGRWHEVLY
jgi:sulfite reductase alpha subunit-like flavoprotein